MPPSRWRRFSADAHSTLLPHHVITLGFCRSSARLFSLPGSSTNRETRAEESQYVTGFLPFRDDEAARAEAFGKARYVCGQEALDIERGPWRIGYSQSHQLRSSLVSGQFRRAVRLDPGHRLAVMRNEHRLPATHLIEETAKPILGFAHTGSFHIAILDSFNSPDPRNGRLATRRYRCASEVP